MLSGVCWSALGWVPPLPLMQSPKLEPLDINRTLVRPASFAFSCQTPGIFSLEPVPNRS